MGLSSWQAKMSLTKTFMDEFWGRVFEIWC